MLSIVAVKTLVVSCTSVVNDMFAELSYDVSAPIVGVC